MGLSRHVTVTDAPLNEKTPEFPPLHLLIIDETVTGTGGDC